MDDALSPGQWLCCCCLSDQFHAAGVGRYLCPGAAHRCFGRAGRTQGGNRGGYRLSAPWIPAVKNCRRALKNRVLFLAKLKPVFVRASRMHICGPARKPVSLLCHGPSRVGRSQLKPEILEGGIETGPIFVMGEFFSHPRGARSGGGHQKKLFLGGGWQGIPAHTYASSPCLVYTSPSPRDAHESRMASSA